MTTVYHLTYWRNAREKTVFQESQQEGWYYDGDYIKPSEVRSAVARLRTDGFEKFQVVEVTAKLISIDHLDILSDP